MVNIQKSSQLRKAIFLDRDGTLNEDPGYLSHPDQLKLFPGVGEGLALLKSAGYLLIVISNQSGVARGRIQYESLALIHERLDQLLTPWAVQIDFYQLCLHHPDEGCECRKPKPKLILDIAFELNIDLSKSYMIGDRLSDLEAGIAAGCRASLLVKTGDGAKAALQIEQKSLAPFVGESFLAVAQWIVRDSSHP